MKFPLPLLITLCAVIPPCRAQEKTLPNPLHPYNRFHNKEVRVQGLAWIQVSAKSKMVLLITPRAQIWLEPWTKKAAEEFQKWNGKLIEVSGILSEGELTSHSSEKQESEKETIKYYRMNDITIEGIDRVKMEITLKTEGIPVSRAPKDKSP